jgi:lactoylglutathione lyase
MNLGTFSVALTVKDIKASREFYEKLGFTKVDGDETQNWLILENGTTKIGLFQGMFEQNILTFNPQDARAIQKNLKAQGIQPTVEADETSEGIAHFMLADPDGNTLLFDQHPPDHISMTQEQRKVAWVDLTVPDAAKVRDFYQAVVGWVPEDVSVGDYADFNMKGGNGKAAAGICWRRGVNANVPSGWMLYITVPDLDASIEQAKLQGGKVLDVRRDDTSKSWVAYIEDPSGAVCALMRL